MKVMFDTNVYISFIRNRAHQDRLQQQGTIKYISAIVLMELWAGARTQKAERLLNQLQKPYRDADRVVTLKVEEYIKIGNILSDFSAEHKELLKKASFLNDVQIALTAQSIGAVLFTEDVQHFGIIRSKLKHLKLEYLIASA